ncbi:Glutamine synthetase [Frankliniella fusca]|uniref:Glutamine synthetase n=1 Tax=Frankliniella fusca TaxID=407009 RepID=A0AAE1HY62_9NEOP|nr:Glutamine synthetase [Frankliniella fusca]
MRAQLEERKVLASYFEFKKTNDFGLFRGATVTDAGQLQQIMVSTPTRRSFVAGYEGTSEGLDRVELGVDCDLVRENIYVGDA